MVGMTVRSNRLILLGACATFGAIVVAEAAWMLPRSQGDGKAATADVVALVDRLALPGLDGHIATILERPLFSASRAAMEMEEADPDDEAEDDGLIEGRLSGIVIGPKTREALFQHDSDKPVAVDVGGKLEGWTITAIEQDHVTLTRAGREQTISLLEDKNAGHPIPRPKAQKKPKRAAPKPAAPVAARPTVQARPPAGRQASR